MRPHILRALLVKEARRHAANKGGFVLCILLVAATFLLSAFRPPGEAESGAAGGELVGGVHRCLIQFAERTPFIVAVENSVPDDLRSQVAFERIRPDEVDQTLNYPPGVGAIQVRTAVEGSGRRVLKFWVWHPPGNPDGMRAYEAWFWRAARRAYQVDAATRLSAAGADGHMLTSPDAADDGPEGGDDLWAERDNFRHLNAEARRLAPSVGPPFDSVELERHGLGAKALDVRSTVGMGLVIFALYFFCVYLLPTMTCEERERGVLLAQALSPATTWELLAAKFLFYPVLGIVLAATLAGIYQPAVLRTLFFWLGLLAVATSFLGVGMTIGTLAKTQRAALMGSMCYLMTVSLFLIICQQNRIPYLPAFLIEYHAPRVIHAALTQEVVWYHWLHLLASFGLGAVWVLVAGWLFRRRGWQ